MRAACYLAPCRAFGHVLPEAHPRLSGHDPAGGALCRPSPQVQLMTMHASNGKEFKVVVVMGDQLDQ